MKCLSMKNGILKIPIGRRDYFLNEKDRIMHNGACYQLMTQLDDSRCYPVISEIKVRYLLVEKLLVFKEKKIIGFSEVDIYIINTEKEM